MTELDIQKVLEGEKGEDAQVDMIKRVCFMQINRAFDAIKVSATPGFQVRSAGPRPFISYDPDSRRRYQRDSRATV